MIDGRESEMSDAEDHARALLETYPPYRHANATNGHCHHCHNEIGLADNQCTGWHPTFKCTCGYETNHPAGAKWASCPHCHAPRTVSDEILDAEVVE